jgi:hypothetical protein
MPALAHLSSSRFFGHTDRDRKQSRDVDGYTAHELIGLVGIRLAWGLRLSTAFYMLTFSCHAYAFALPPRQEPLNNLGHNPEE